MSPTNALEVNAERLWATLERSAEIGRFRGTGLRRLALSREDQEMRDIFVGWAREAGCAVEVDRSAIYSHAVTASIASSRRLPSAATSTRRSAAAATTAFSV